MPVSLKLERLLEEKYDNDVKSFAAAVTRCNLRLRRTQQDLYDHHAERRPWVHSLQGLWKIEGVWSSPQVEELDLLVDALLPDNLQTPPSPEKYPLQQNLSSRCYAAVQLSLASRRGNDLYLLPVTMPTLEDAGRAVFGWMIGGAVGSLLPAPLRALRTAVKVTGAAINVSRGKMSLLVVNPFEHLGNELVKYAQEAERSYSGGYSGSDGNYRQN